MRMEISDQIDACLGGMRDTFEMARKNDDDAKVWVSFQALCDFGDVECTGGATMRDGDTLESLVARAADDCIEYSAENWGYENRDLSVNIWTENAGTASYDFHDSRALSELYALQNLGTTR